MVKVIDGKEIKTAAKSAQQRYEIAKRRAREMAQSSGEQWAVIPSNVGPKAIAAVRVPDDVPMMFLTEAQS